MAVPMGRNEAVGARAVGTRPKALPPPRALGGRFILYSRDTD